MTTPKAFILDSNLIVQIPTPALAGDAYGSAALAEAKQTIPENDFAQRVAAHLTTADLEGTTPLQRLFDAASDAVVGQWAVEQAIRENQQQREASELAE